MSYDLLTVPTGYKTELALIVAPYFDETFSRKMIRALTPGKLRYVLEDSAREREIAKLKKMCREENAAMDVKIGLGRTNGIVHLKIYYFLFSATDPQSGKLKYRRRLLIGSANATEAAFSGRRNAELLADLTISTSTDKNLVEYVRDMVRAVQNKGGGEIAGGEFPATDRVPKLLVPSFSIKPEGPAPGFDAWLQRGYLANKYPGEQSFLTMQVKLKQALPRGRTAGIFADLGFIQQGQGDVVRFTYIPQAAGDGAAESDPRWRAPYCVWTALGYWMSEDCYWDRDIRRMMKTQASSSKRKRIDQFLSHKDDSEWVQKQKVDFLAKLKKLWSTLQKRNIAPEDYLQTKNGKLDLRLYGAKFEEKVGRDFLRASDEEFYRRYTTGHDFSKVPKFRQDAVAWKAFTHSWAETVIQEARKTRGGSKVMQAIREVCKARDETLAALDADDLTAILRNEWHNSIKHARKDHPISDLVRGYYLRGRKDQAASGK